MLEKAVRHGGDKVVSYAGNYDFYVRNGFKPISYCIDDTYIEHKEELIFFKYTKEKFEKMSRKEFVKKIPISENYNKAKEELNR